MFGWHYSIVPAFSIGGIFMDNTNEFLEEGAVIINILKEINRKFDETLKILQRYDKNQQDEGGNGIGEQQHN